ncbi:putative F-box domain-containing protein [Lupinus albus]|uniref:Putative F-box domain-containing protein n=1 Tax=Lupinus albus TaxID=3870 RepID=A0A6A4QYI6_LUPAL|nr:putative F-box domain-containing protein [Lupinus albus]
MANIVATIEYLVHEILLRLPVKSLLRFKCVSKQWLALISEPYFCNSHTLRLYRTSRVFPSSILHALSDSRNCQVIPLKTINVSDSFKFHNVNVPIGMVIQSSNGLLLIQRITLDGDEAEVEYFVCNPTTNKSVPVIFPTQQLSSSVISLFICFEPWKSLHYKLVSFRSKNYESIDDMSSLVISTDIIYNEYVINVYSSETRSWSEPGFTFTSHDNTPPYQINAVYFNGSLYWPSYILSKCIYFDLDSQNLMTCPMPFDFEDKRSLKFCESGGHLYFLFYLRDDSLLKIMDLNEENSEWSLRYQIKLCDSYSHILFCFTYCVVKQENDKDSLLLIWYNDKVMLYNLVDSTFRDLSSYSPSLMIETSSYFFQHYENLSCVDPIKNMKIDFDVGVVLHGYSHVGERDHTLSVHLVWPDYDRV